MDLIRICNSRLDNAHWDDHQDVERLLSALLNDIRDNCGLIGRMLEAMTDNDFAELDNRSRETQTHYKWLIARCPDNRYRVWLHEFKEEAILQQSYAVKPHNHRYSLGILMLRGGYQHFTYCVVRENDGSRATLTAKSTGEVGRDSFYVLNEQIVHSLGGIKPGTLSICVEGPPMRRYSESFTLKSGAIKQHVPFAERAADLRRMAAYITSL